MIVWDGSERVTVPVHDVCSDRDDVAVITSVNVRLADATARVMEAFTLSDEELVPVVWDVGVRVVVTVTVPDDECEARCVGLRDPKRRLRDIVRDVLRDTLIMSVNSNVQVDVVVSEGVTGGLSDTVCCSETVLEEVTVCWDIVRRALRVKLRVSTSLGVTERTDSVWVTCDKDGEYETALDHEGDAV